LSTVSRVAILANPVNRLVSALAMAMAGGAGAGVFMEPPTPRLPKPKRSHVRHQGAKERARRLRQKANRGG